MNPHTCKIFEDIGSVEYRHPVTIGSAKVIKVYTDLRIPRLSIFVERSSGERIPASEAWPTIVECVRDALLRKSIDPEVALMKGSEK